MEDDIYSDLDTLDLGDEIEKLKETNKGLIDQLKHLDNDMKKLCDRISQLEKEKHNLTVNISELFNTAKAELQRKDKKVEDLQRQLDNIIFKRNGKRPLEYSTETFNKKSRICYSSSKYNEHFEQNIQRRSNENTTTNNESNTNNVTMFSNKQNRQAPVTRQRFEEKSIAIEKKDKYSEIQNKYKSTNLYKYKHGSHREKEQKSMESSSSASFCLEATKETGFGKNFNEINLDSEKTIKDNENKTVYETLVNNNISSINGIIDSKELSENRQPKDNKKTTISERISINNLNKNDRKYKLTKIDLGETDKTKNSNEMCINDDFVINVNHTFLNRVHSRNELFFNSNVRFKNEERDIKDEEKARNLPNITEPITKIDKIAEISDETEEAFSLQISDEEDITQIDKFITEQCLKKSVVLEKNNCINISKVENCENILKHQHSQTNNENKNPIEDNKESLTLNRSGKDIANVNEVEDRAQLKRDNVSTVVERKEAEKINDDIKSKDKESNEFKSKMAQVVNERSPTDVNKMCLNNKTPNAEPNNTASVIKPSEGALNHSVNSMIRYLFGDNLSDIEQQNSDILQMSSNITADGEFPTLHITENNCLFGPKHSTEPIEQEMPQENTPKENTFEECLNQTNTTQTSPTMGEPKVRKTRKRPRCIISFTD